MASSSGCAVTRSVRLPPPGRPACSGLVIRSQEPHSLFHLSLETYDPSTYISSFEGMAPYTLASSSSSPFQLKLFKHLVQNNHSLSLFLTIINIIQETSRLFIPKQIIDHLKRFIVICSVIYRFQRCCLSLTMSIDLSQFKAARKTK